MEVLNHHLSPNINVVPHVFFVTCQGQSQKKDLRPIPNLGELKLLKDVCFGNHCLSAHPLQNLHDVAKNLHVGAVCKGCGRSGNPWVQIHV